MQFRLNFDDRVQANLLSKIEQRANGGSTNKALQIMIIEWSALEDAGKWPESGRKVAGIKATDQDLEDEIDTAMASIDEDF